MELKSLFVHEYHHACRLNAVQKPIDSFTLLDSLIMEGLAEHAVRDECGKEYAAKWNQFYDERRLVKAWHDIYRHYLHLKKTDPLHDRLLYGSHAGPLTGYQIGYYLINSEERIFP